MVGGIGRRDDFAAYRLMALVRVLSQEPRYLLMVNTLTRKALPEHAIPGRLRGGFNQELYADSRLKLRFRYVNIRVGRGWLNLLVRRDLPTSGAVTPGSD